MSLLLKISSFNYDLTHLGPQCRTETFFIHKAWIFYGYDDPELHKVTIQLKKTARTRERKKRRRKRQKAKEAETEQNIRDRIERRELKSRNKAINC